jgi:hypothetical protein
MNRRNMLSFLGLGAAAGPALVQQYSSNPVPTQGYYDDGAIKATLASVGDQKEYVKRMQEELSQLNDPKEWMANRLAEELRDFYNGYSSFRYETMDPDIRSMKSISESTKIRMHEAHKNSVTHRIAEVLGLKNV